MARILTCSAREKQIFMVTKPFDVFFSELQHKYPHIHLHYFQSNVEGELINELQGSVLSMTELFLTREDTHILLLLLAMRSLQ
jgi:3-dehydroquinate dehydratase